MFLGCAPFHVSLQLYVVQDRLLCFHSGVWFLVCVWLVLCCLFCLVAFCFVFLCFFVSAWWNRGIADEVTIASFCKAVTGTAVMARSANEKKKMASAKA